MSLASVAKHKQEEIQKRQQQIEELDRTKNEIRRKQIARLNAALLAIKEIKEEKYNQDDSVIGKGIVLEDHTSKQLTLPIPRARTSRHQRGTARRRSLAARRRRTAINQSIVSQQQKEKEPDRILVYVR